MPKPDNYTHPLVIESLEQARHIASQSMFLISKFLASIVGEFFKAKKQRTSEILVEVHSEQLATKLLKQTRIAYLDIMVTPYEASTPQAVLSEPDRANATERLISLKA